MKAKALLDVGALSGNKSVENYVNEQFLFPGSA
jgi:hypothetical protein